MNEEGGIKAVIVGPHKHVTVEGLTPDQEDELVDQLDATYGFRLMTQVSPLEFWMEDVSPDMMRQIIQVALTKMQVGYEFQETI